MKLKFRCECRDKYTEAVYQPGMVYDFPDDRGQEIINTGYARMVLDEPEEPQPQPVEEQPDINVQYMPDMSIKELRALAKEVGVSVRGTKAEIIERILVKEVDEKQVK